MACCYVAATAIAFIIRTCDAFDIDLHLQYNDGPVDPLDTKEGFDELKARTSGMSGLTVLSISGMTCAACTTSIENALMGLKGVQKAEVSLALQEARVFHCNTLVEDDLVASVKSVGYEASIGERTPQHKIQTLRNSQELRDLRVSMRGLGFFSMIIFVLGTGADSIGLVRVFLSAVPEWFRPTLLLIITTIVAARYGKWIFSDAIGAARSFRSNMHTLISASTFLGLSLALFNILKGQAVSRHTSFDSIIGILLIVTAARYMDLLSRRQALDTFAGLYSLLDETSSAQLAQHQGRIPTGSLRLGDQIIIEPYSVVPCDGYIINGHSHVSESIITGETRSKKKAVGDVILAGSRNGPGELLVIVNQDHQGSFLLQLVRSIESSISSKPSVQNRIDLITQHFVVGIFTISLAAGAASFLLAHKDGALDSTIDVAGRKMMAILAAACPCALGLATPCAVMAGIDFAWQRGILMLQGGETMEILQNVTHIVMDKTGTLTLGEPTVTEIHLTKPWTDCEQDLAVIVCSVEEGFISTHPLAAAIFHKLLPMCEDSWQDFQSYGSTRALEEAGGRGVWGEVYHKHQWRTVCIGNVQHMREHGIRGLELMKSYTDTKGIKVWVGIDGDVAASLEIHDAVRRDAISTMNALKSRGLQVSMLTGDHAVEAHRISQELDIPVIASCATPQIKLEHIKSLQSQGHKVVMVGDGMNDGPSLAGAEVGIMMAHGRNCLSAGGNVLIMKSQLRAIPTLLDLAERTTRQVSANIKWALAYNIVAVALATGIGAPFGLTITPAIAATMMSFSSIFITSQGLLLRGRLSKQLPK